MEVLENLKNWLAGFDGWEAAAVDTLDAVPGSCGLFPLGVEVLKTREDVLGNRHSRLRQTFLLRRSAPRGENAARWVADFSRWAAENAATAPALGDRQQLRAEKGRLLSAQGAGTGIYEVRLTLEYDSEE
jgi:hypothetical protein